MAITDEERFAAWVKRLSDPRTGIPLPTARELQQALERPCRYLNRLDDVPHA